jgi:hypothetical protein
VAFLGVAFVIKDPAASGERMVAAGDGERWPSSASQKDELLGRLLVRSSAGCPWKGNSVVDGHLRWVHGSNPLANRGEPASPRENGAAEVSERHGPGGNAPQGHRANMTT